MKILVIIARVLLGAGFMFFGLNILHPFLPMPPMDATTLPGRFATSMAESHWMLLVGVFQFLGGLLVILGRTAPLGLALLAPVLVNILAFHIFMMKGAGIAPGLVFTVLEIFLIFAYRAYFLPLFTVNAGYGKAPY